MTDKEKTLAQELEEEVRILDKWIEEIRTGGWSTVHLSAMERRRDKIKATLYDYKS